MTALPDPQPASQALPVSPADPQLEQHNQRLEHLLEQTDLENMSPEAMLRWADEQFPGRAVISTSFQYSGLVMIHMAVQAGLGLRLATVDTLRLHPETYAFIRDIEERYQRRVEVQQPDPAQVQAMINRHGEYLFFDSKFKQQHCCQIRKVRPHDQLLRHVDCWIAGNRRDQSGHREGNTPKGSLVPEYGTQRKILKLFPMADWSEKQLLEYMATHQVPRHPLYDQGYASIGCTICSTPVLPGEPKRAGRWRWFNNPNTEEADDKKECGLHYNI
jgi:phosphoadenosine phosphosulfate reductase